MVLLTSIWCLCRTDELLERALTLLLTCLGDEDSTCVGTILDALFTIGNRLLQGSAILDVLKQEKQRLTGERIIDRISSFGKLTEAIVSPLDEAQEKVDEDGDSDWYTTLQKIATTFRCPKYANRIAEIVLGGKRVHQAHNDSIQLMTTPSLRQRALDLGATPKHSGRQEKSKVETRIAGGGKEGDHAQAQASRFKTEGVPASTAHHVHWIAMLFARLNISQSDLKIGRGSTESKVGEEGYGCEGQESSTSCAGIALLRPSLQSLDIPTRIAGCLASVRCCFQGSKVNFQKISQLIKRGMADVNSSNRVLAESVIRIFTYLVPLQVRYVFLLVFFFQMKCRYNF